ncbi:DUF4192 domain-containing protein [Nocardia sp. NPDC049220]|uniref:DUF4192 domain-containing protein n=1 Tax=Nocardia sp. NPDC049220 TaxID=3155273 RepID=UPI0033FF513C
MTTSATPFHASEPPDREQHAASNSTFCARLRRQSALPYDSPAGVRARAAGGRAAAGHPAPSSETAQTAEDSARGRANRARCAEDPPPYIRDMSEHSVRVNDPGELIAAVPAMVGFTPERSVVVLVLRRGNAHGALVDAVVRFDLEGPDGRRVRAGTLAGCVARICAHDEAVEVLAVIVDDRAEHPRSEGDVEHPRCAAGRFDALVGALARRLAACDISLGGVWAAGAIAAGEPWWTLSGPDLRGVLRDPATSVVALTHVLEGRPIRGSRSELTALVAVDPLARAQVAAQLEDALALARERYARAARRGDPNSYSRQALDYVLWQVANMASGAALLAPELAKLAAALRDRAVRDTMFAVAVGDHAAAAEALWGALARALSGADRAEAAALLGYSAYVHGDGPLAGVALDAALDADPDHPMAVLLDTALRMGMRPERLRRLARSGYHTAAGLGVDLGTPAP